MAMGKLERFAAMVPRTIWQDKLFSKRRFAAMIPRIRWQDKQFGNFGEFWASIPRHHHLSTYSKDTGSQND